MNYMILLDAAAAATEEGTTGGRGWGSMIGFAPKFILLIIYLSFPVSTDYLFVVTVQCLPIQL